MTVNAQVAASLLPVRLFLAIIKPISGCVRIACSGFMMTGLIASYGNTVCIFPDASRLLRLFIHKFDASCWNNLRRVCKYQVEARLIADLLQPDGMNRLDETWWHTFIKLVKFTTCIASPFKRLLECIYHEILANYLLTALQRSLRVRMTS